MAKKLLIIAGILGCICATPIPSYMYGDISVAESGESEYVYIDYRYQE